MYSAIIANEKFEYLGEIYCQDIPAFLASFGLCSPKKKNN